MTELLLGDCLEVMKTLPDASVDAVVTDPPYGLSFMGKRWDYDVPTTEVWAECLRVLKPGGHLLAFAGTRTQHRMAVRIEDAGFEIRDMIAWVYGSGFPKSLDVSKAIDKAAGAEREVVGVAGKSGSVRNSMAGDFAGGEYTSTAPATPEAQQWAGWGTALKPSIESVTWATKPFPSERERAKILENLWKIEARLWLLSFASAADQSSMSSPSEYAEACATARWTAESVTSTQDALRDLMGTSPSVLALNTSLNIVSSWRRTLQESSTDGSTSTTATESKTTTDWKTLSCCLSQITPESIIQASSLPGGFSANASTAERIFSASLALLQATRTLSAIEPATWQALDACQAEAVSPSLEPVVMARKPLAGTVAANVLTHGTGGLNVDGCRVGTEGGTAKGNPPKDESNGIHGHGINGACDILDIGKGRWPANLIHDGSDEVVGLFPQSNSSATPRNRSPRADRTQWRNGGAEYSDTTEYGDTGSAARFFKQCKGYTEAWPNLTPEPANTAGSTSSPSRQFVAFALSDAATWALPVGSCNSLSLAPSTSATASELRQLSESVITAIQSIAPKFWQESKPAKLTLTLSHASFAVTREQTGITTITASHWKSDGSAEPVTFNITGTNTEAGDQVSAPRAFYTAKASRDDRSDGNTHPTVKPTGLMRYLCRLVTPPGGIVLDPFMGSGSTGKAAMLEGFEFIGIEREAAYHAIAERRIGRAAAAGYQPSLLEVA